MSLKYKKTNTEQGRIRSFALLITDVVMFSVATFICFAVYKKLGAKYELTILYKAWPLIILMLFFNISGRLYCGNIIYPGLAINPAEELRRLVLGCWGAFLAFFAILSISRGSEMFSRVALVTSALLSSAFMVFGRMILRYVLWKLNIGKISAVIAGDAELAKNVAEKIINDNYSILTLKASFCEKKIIGGIHNCSLKKLKKVSEKIGAYYLIYCNRGTGYSDDVEKYLSSFRHILVVNETERFPVLWSYPVSFYRYFSFEISNRFRRCNVLFQKQLLEVILAVIGMFVCFLPGVLLAILVKLSSPGPVFYRANRLGLHGKPIKVLKLRTMYEDADEKLEQLLAASPEMYEEWEKNYKLEKDPRVTKIGKFLRATSLDEIPQFWNVIKGEMALIGPRPIVKNEVKYYGNDYEIFSSVKPGITGLWQVSGRSNLSYSERVALDVFYVNNWSLWLDLYIFVATFNAVFFRRGAK